MNGNQIFWIDYTNYVQDNYSSQIGADRYQKLIFEILLGELCKMGFLKLNLI